MALTEEQKRENRVQRTLERFRCLSIGKCVLEVARQFQAIVRLGAADANGMVTCCSCGRRVSAAGRDCHGGHWIGRGARAVVFDARNVHPQCSQCNRFGTNATRQGYDEFMRAKYGQEVMDEIVRLSKQPRQWTKEELAELYVQFSEELSAIQRQP